MCGHRNYNNQCNTCKSRRKRERNPMRYAYDTLRANCIRRKGREFWGLTFDEFKQYAIETKYLQGKGRTKESWSIDCIDPTMGYFIGNIRPLTIGNNSRKHTKILHYTYVPEEGRMIATVTRNTPPHFK